MDFTVEEINLIAIYKSKSKAKTIMRLHDIFPFMDTEMKEIATSTARKLNAMTDDEYALAVFLPATFGE